VLPDGSIADAKVGSKGGEARLHTLMLGDGRELESQLSTVNHCRERLASAESYCSIVASFCEHLAEETSVVEDGAWEASGAHVHSHTLCKASQQSSLKTK
jgi:hypothetical protein